MADKIDSGPTDPASADEGHEDEADDGMGSHIYRLSEKSWTETFTWRSLMVQEAGIFLSSIKESRSADFERKVNERSLFEKRVVIPWAMLAELVMDDGVVQFNWFDRIKGKDVRSRLKFEDQEDAENVVAIVARKKNWEAHAYIGTVWRGLLGRGIGLLLVAGLTWVLLKDAHAIEQGIAPDLEGRRVATKLFFWKVAGWLGVTGIWVTCALVSAVIVSLAVHWYRTRPQARMWRKAH